MAAGYGPTVEKTFSFDNDLYEAAAEAAWVFVTLPVDMADEISESVPRRRGFGSVRVAARIGSSEWNTSIFPSKADRSYVLPVKRAIRDNERVDVGDAVHVTIRLIED
jgi:hypothetical protein